jgi:hypothetical protein
MTKGVSSLKGEFFSAVASLNPGLTEFSHPLDQSDQARCHLWLSSLVINER